ncbi:MAG: serine/threonine-protein kinase [Gemmatimonadota bacterium]
MPHRQLIDPIPGSTPAGAGESRPRRRPLPPDLLREAADRLGIMSLMGAVLWVVGTILAHLALRAIRKEGPNWALPHLLDIVAGANVVASLLLFAFTRRKHRDPHFLLNLGLAYLVFTAFALGLAWHSEVGPAGQMILPTITWSGVIVLLFSAIVPITPDRILVAGFISVSMNPIGMLIARERGWWQFEGLSPLLIMHYPDYLLVGAAVLVSHVVTRLGQHVVKAREMGSYELGELLGSGGMGQVYRATHRMLARPAAIKLIRPEMMGGGNGAAAELAVKRFRREAQVAAGLRSPHTVELYDFGVTRDRTLYFVMELLDGVNLEELIRQTGPVLATRAIHILRQVCDSLEEAHAQGLVHRDIKPANIHIGRFGLRYDFVKVLDFGLVKSMAAPSTEQTLGTATGLTPGTPAYMAPEMILGEPVDGRADLYALGCVAYFLLTGQPVFVGDAPMQVMAKHLHAEPVPPSERAQFPVPPALDRLVLACLAKRPEDRPQGAADVARLLAAIDGPEWSQAQAVEWWRVNPPQRGDGPASGLYSTDLSE